jgi:AraC-like DNA-binding protein
MGNSIIHSKSISELLQGMRLEKPTHPLITIIDTAKLGYGEETIGARYSSSMYCIALKDSGCGINYGRNTYDFDEGVLIFTAPNQVITLTKAQELGEVNGWMLYFHPDLIRNTALGTKIDDYSFFNYEVHEALHLSDQEQSTLTDCITMVQHEIKERIDNHSQQVLVSHIELLLNYSTRFYERQFNTRTNQIKDIVSQFERELKGYYKEKKALEFGVPTIQRFADSAHISQHYFSDLIKKETGRAPKDHINEYVVEQAKNMILGTEQSISEIAYELGFNYPHYFTRLFKSKTGRTPVEYRSLN